MTATDVIHQLQTLPPQEVAKVRDWLMEHVEESPELLAAIDEGLRSLRDKGARVVTRDELEQKVRQWAGRSR
jgi:peptidoglycan/xylan/chitin deacetylase (PgdA/CDA1 family)